METADQEWFAHRAEAWARRVGPRHFAAAAATLPDGVTLRSVVLVEGSSDRAALEVLAARRGRDLSAEGAAIVTLGGSKNIWRFVRVFGSTGHGVRLAGMCDANEERDFRRALARGGFGSVASRDRMEQLGFFVCVDDLEDELIRALGSDAVEEVIETQGDLRSWRTFRKQPAQQHVPLHRQLRRFTGTRSGRKISYAAVMVSALDPARVPHPLGALLDQL